MEHGAGFLLKIMNKWVGIGIFMNESILYCHLNYVEWMSCDWKGDFMMNLFFIGKVIFMMNEWVVNLFFIWIMWTSRSPTSYEDLNPHKKCDARAKGQHLKARISTGNVKGELKENSPKLEMMDKMFCLIQSIWVKFLSLLFELRLLLHLQ